MRPRSAPSPSAFFNIDAAPLEQQAAEDSSEVDRLDVDHEGVSFSHELFFEGGHGLVDPRRRTLDYDKEEEKTSHHGSSSLMLPLIRRSFSDDDEDEDVPDEDDRSG